VGTGRPHAEKVRRQLFGAIVLTGTECELVVYPREGHVPVERAHLLDALQRTQAWFDRHLMIGGVTT
jgi:dipeptidyl aminopeptidase/acylaminoacyl peptidase